MGVILNIFLLGISKVPDRDWLFFLLLSRAARMVLNCMGQYYSHIV